MFKKFLSYVVYLLIFAVFFICFPLLCKGSAFSLCGQERRWFLLVLLRLSAVCVSVLARFSCGI